MKELTEQIGSYNIFNYLFPGVVFSIILQNFTIFNLLSENIVLTAFMSYFVGMIISRFGSLIVEPLLKKIKFIKHKNYKKFVEASQKDPKLAILSEQSNSYRTILAMILLIGLAKTYEFLLIQFHFLEEFNFYIILLILLFLFLYSVKKQTSYISKRIDKNLK